MSIIIIILAFSIWSCQAVLENCQRPTLENGFFVPHLDIYEHGVNIYYGCNTGLKPALETWWGKITCRDGHWSHIPQCIDNTHCIVPHVPNTQTEDLRLKTSYAHNEELSFKCKSDFKFENGKSRARCENGKWTLPKCTRKPEFCAPPPRVVNGMIIQPYQDAFKNGDKLDYVCAEGYKLQGTRYTICRNGQWSNSPTCVEKSPCSRKPAVRNARPADELKTSYNHGDTVQFVCGKGYRFEGTDSAQCEDGEWNPPKCIDASLCPAPRVANARAAENLASSYSSGSYVSFQCDAGYQFVGAYYARCVNGNWDLPRQPAVDLAQFYANGRSVRFECDSGYEFEGTDTAWCVEGIWRLPECKRRGPHGGSVRPDPDVVPMPGGNCDTQPLIENGDVTDLPGGNELKAQCYKFYKLTGPETIRCVNGKWTELPVCKPPCKLDRTKIHTSHPDEYLQEGELKRFYCGQLWKIDISCIKGEAVYGECKYHYG
ncbi:hypothetical protein AMELA_G00067230 [Ameiurus melas]|uniref:Sushi domain-containing protein n=1 Tax=Ameiurus melas TaxID=219545 RepID=A0A7J6B3L6_AMEME|nr:hypothetical protein AMELA_G00067230 [Ameiurus melas]